MDTLNEMQQVSNHLPHTFVLPHSLLLYSGFFRINFALTPLSMFAGIRCFITKTNQYLYYATCSSLAAVSCLRSACSFLVSEPKGC